MSANIEQIYVANPASTLQGTDLFYLGRSPYGLTNDMATLWSTILGYIPGSVTHSITASTANLVANQTFITMNAGTVTLTLPITAAVGSYIEIIGSGGGGWTVAQNALQSIVVGKDTSTVGTGGSVSSTQANDAMKIICIVANTTFQVTSGVTGGFTIV